MVANVTCRRTRDTREHLSACSTHKACHFTRGCTRAACRICSAEEGPLLTAPFVDRSMCTNNHTKGRFCSTFEISTNLPHQRAKSARNTLSPVFSCLSANVSSSCNPAYPLFAPQNIPQQVQVRLWRLVFFDRCMTWAPHLPAHTHTQQQQQRQRNTNRIVQDLSMPPTMNPGKQENVENIPPWSNF